MKKKEITPSLLKKLYTYDGERLYHKRRPLDLFVKGSVDRRKAAMSTFNTRFAGKPVTAKVTNDGVHRMSIFQHQFVMARVIWAVTQGEWPNVIDHIDGNPSNNALRNLRNVTQADNCRNMKVHVLSKTKKTGVSWSAEKKKWRAHITYNYKQKHLGYFDKFEHAVAARAKADADFGFHQNHGKR
jgi:hypothetical protein